MLEYYFYAVIIMTLGILQIIISKKSKNIVSVIQSTIVFLMGAALIYEKFFVVSQIIDAFSDFKQLLTVELCEFSMLFAGVICAVCGFTGILMVTVNMVKAMDNREESKAKENVTVALEDNVEVSISDCDNSRVKGERKRGNFKIVK